MHSIYWEDESKRALVACEKNKEERVSEELASEKDVREGSFRKCVLALVAVELALACVSVLYGASVLPRHSSAAGAVYAAFCMCGLGVAALLWYVFVVRRPLWWGHRATPARLAVIVGVSAVAAVLLELGTLIGAPLSNPWVLGDWHVSRIAAFFAMSLPLVCCAVMYDWRALAARVRTAALADNAALAKRVCGYAVVAMLAGGVAALSAGAASENFGVGNPDACRLFAGVVAALVVVLVGLRRSVADRPERALLAVLLASGFLFSALTPWYTHVSWDDHIHYDRAVATSYLIDPEYTSGDAALVGKAFHDVAYFSRYHDDPGWVNAYDEHRLKDRYQQLDDLGEVGKRAKPGARPAGYQGEDDSADDPAESHILASESAADGATEDAVFEEGSASEEGAAQGEDSAQGEDAAQEEAVAQGGDPMLDEDVEQGEDPAPGEDSAQGQSDNGLLPLGECPDIPHMGDLGPGARLFDGDDPQAVRLDGAVTLRGVSIIEYYPVAYIPAAAGLWVSRLLGLSTSMAFFVGRLFSMVCYSLVVFFACKRLKSGKMFLSACALVPTMVYLASNYSYDAWLTSFLMLGFAIFAGELQRPDEPISWRWFLLMIAAFLVGLGPKAVYVPVAALLLFMPRAKFAKRGNGRGAPALTHGRYLAVVFASALFVLATFVLPMLFAGPGEGDARGGDVDPAVQIAFITGQPLAYLTVFVKFCEYFFTIGNAPFVLTDFCGVETSSYAYAVMALLLIVALVDRRACDIPLATHAKRAAMAVLFLLTFFLICTALFISFTPAGWDWITGVQGRYLLPLLFPFGLVCLNFRPLCKLGERVKSNCAARTVYHYSVFVLSGFFVLASIAEAIVLNA